MIDMNYTAEMARSRNAKNGYQGAWPRVLCVCSAGLLRSPTLAWVLSNEPYNCNTRAAGSHEEYALVPLDQVLIDWAKVVVFVNQENFDHAIQRKLRVPESAVVLNVPDCYSYREEDLVKAIRNELEQINFAELLK